MAVIDHDSQCLAIINHPCTIINQLVAMNHQTLIIDNPALPPSGNQPFLLVAFRSLAKKNKNTGHMVNQTKPKNAKNLRTRGWISHPVLKHRCLIPSQLSQRQPPGQKSTRAFVCLAFEYSPAVRWKEPLPQRGDTNTTSLHGSYILLYFICTYISSCIHIL